MVKYKRIDVAIEAANQRGIRLLVFGDGPERVQLEKLAGPTVKFVGLVSTVQLANLVRESRAFLFPGVEDFGILPVEVQAGGRPVIALARGGALETVKQGETGLLYAEDSVLGLIEAIDKFEAQAFQPEACRQNALHFGRERFEKKMSGFLSRIMEGM